jgi:hypothetical protein
MHLSIINQRLRYILSPGPARDAALFVRLPQLPDWIRVEHSNFLTLQFQQKLSADTINSRENIFQPGFLNRMGVKLLK